MNPTRTTARAALACLSAAATVIAAAVTMTGTAPAAARAATVPAATVPAATAPAAPAGLPVTSPGHLPARLPVTSPGRLPAAPSRPTGAGPGHVVPMWRLPRGAQPSQTPGRQAAPDSIGEPGGYDPGELRAYLGLHGTGAGQTVAVTEAFNVQNPLPVAIVGRQHDVTHSLAGYDSWYGLPPACSATVTTGCFNLTFTAPHGTSTSDPGDAFENWRPEAVLDVELIHALLPQASIVVVEARNDRTPSMMAALDYAQSLHPAAVSNSWGENESAGDPGMNSHCPATGAPCVFASGDNGNYASCIAANGSSADCGGYPAANPDVLAVGGTTLDLAPTGQVRSETAWSGSGGGISGDQRFPAYQRQADPYPAGRGIPDVSFDADPNSGIAIYMDFLFPCTTGICDYQEWDEFGGTSVGAPAWASILTSAAQHRAAAGKPPLTIAGVHAAVYAKAAGTVIADISTGVNGICGSQCSAAAGYDLVTGMGSPRPRIVSYLARSPR